MYIEVFVSKLLYLVKVKYRKPHQNINSDINKCVGACVLFDRKEEETYRYVYINI